MDILHLIENKAFEALTPQEMSFVLKQMSVEEYKEQRMVITMTQETFAENDNNSTLVAPLPYKALKALQKKNKGGILVLFQRKITLWKAAAVFLAMLGSYHFLTQGYAPETETIYLTEYVDREVLVPADPDTVIKEVVVEVQKEKLARVEPRERVPSVSSLNTGDKEVYDFDQIAVLGGLESELLLMNRKEGISVREDTLTKQILGI